MPSAELPVGFERFHRKAFINYQLNRAYGLGYANREELRQAAKTIRKSNDCIAVFEELSEQAEHDDRWLNAASYLRIAEFFTPGRSAEKLLRYDRYRRLFDAGIATTGIERHEVQYSDGFLPAYLYRSQAGPAHGTVLVHAGFDSLIEEFFVIWQRLSAAGFDVVAFDGPGQGGARRLGGITFDHDWEKPVGAVLDHFKLNSAALVGVSMGGHWALRAAGREPRIDRVVAWPPVYDWLLRLPGPLRPVVNVMFRRRRFMRWSIRVRARLIPTLGRVVDQTLYNLDSDDPIDVMDWFLGMNPTHLDSARVTQDVLVMCGEHDAFQPERFARAQIGALTNARSVTMRLFTKAEHADQHCQMGNMSLACDVLATWLTDDREAT